MLQRKMMKILAFFSALLCLLEKNIEDITDEISHFAIEGFPRELRKCSATLKLDLSHVGFDTTTCRL